MIPACRSDDKFERVEIIQSMFSDHSGIKIEINNRKRTEMFLNWKLSNKQYISKSTYQKGSLEGD